MNIDVSNYFSALITIGCLQLVALASPGPDFILIVRNSLLYTRKTAVLTGLGIGLGVSVHIIYILLGVGYVLTQVNWLFIVFKLSGCAYLIYLGVRSLLSNKTPLKMERATHNRVPQSLNSFKALRMGFLTNATNPKAMLFLLSLFTVVLDVHAPRKMLMLCGCEVIIMTIIWFAVLGYCLSSQNIRRRVEQFGHWIDRISGVLLISVGLKLALTEVA